MKKQLAHKSAPDSEAPESRQPDMEEKRKLEKLLRWEIDSAITRYNARAEAMRDNLIERLTKNPPAEVRKLFESYSLAQKQARQLETKLDGLGYDITYDNTLWVNTRGTMMAQLTAFDAVAKENRETLQTLKRDYVIKLFTDHADARSLFASLSKDLERLTG